MTVATTRQRDKQNNVEDFHFAIAEGRVIGHVLVEKFGRNNSIANATEEDIFSYGGNFFYPTAAAKVALRSGSALDDGTSSPMGSGARSVQVFGCDDNYNDIDETITINGGTLVNSTKDFFRVWRAKCIAVGSGGVNAGEIWVTSAASTSSPLDVIGHIGAGEGQSEQTQYTIPAGFTGHIINGRVACLESAGAAVKETSAVVKIWLRSFIADTSPLTDPGTTNNYGSWRKVQSVDVNSRGSTGEPISTVSKIAEKTDLRFSAEVSVDDTAVNARFNMILVKNTI